MMRTTKKMVTRNFAKVLLCGASAAAFSFTTAAAQLVDIGVNAVVRNNVTLQSSDAEVPRAAIPSEAVFLGDQVKSGPEGALQILLKDETVFSVGANCDLTIDEFVYDPATEEGSITASVASGVFRFMSGKVARNEPENVRIDTPVAFMGVRGTILDVLVGEEAIEVARQSGVSGAENIEAGEGATLVVLRGPGRDQRGLNKDGGVYINSGGDEITLWKSGAAAFVPRNGAEILGPFTIPDQLFLALNENTSPSTVAGPRPARPNPNRDIRGIIRNVPDLNDNRLPPRPPRGSDCLGECPNAQEGQQFSSPGNTFTNGNSGIRGN